jgi:hypothetical protein
MEVKHLYAVVVARNKQYMMQGLKILVGIKEDINLE